MRRSRPKNDHFQKSSKMLRDKKINTLRTSNNSSNESSWVRCEESIFLLETFESNAETEIAQSSHIVSVKKIPTAARSMTNNCDTKNTNNFCHDLVLLKKKNPKKWRIIWPSLFCETYSRSDKMQLAADLGWGFDVFNLIQHGGILAQTKWKLSKTRPKSDTTCMRGGSRLCSCSQKKMIGVGSAHTWPLNFWNLFDTGLVF